MADYAPYGSDDGVDRRRYASSEGIRVRRCRPAKRTDCEDAAMLNVMLGMRVMSCFSKGSRRLTSQDIGGRLDVSENDVTRTAIRLVRLGYLALDRKSNQNAWVLMPDER